MWIVSLALLCGCSNRENAAERCERISSNWRAAVEALDDSCTTSADCVVTGDGTEACDGDVPAIGTCAGVAVNSNAYLAHSVELDDLAAGYDDCTCDDVDCESHCTGGRPVCYEGHCIAQTNTACWDGVDAGTIAP